MTSAQVEDLGIDDVDRFFLSSTGEAGAGQRRRADGLGEAFRWRADGTVDALLTPSGARGSATAVSDDGSIVCGRSIGPGTAKRAIRWDASGTPTDISLPTSPINVPVAMSRDGQTIALETRATNGAKLAAIWTATGGVVTLPPPAAFPRSGIIDLSQDGSTAIGRFTLDETNTSPREYFLWSSSNGITPFTGPAGTKVFASDISADGSVVTGTALIGLQPNIFRWSAAGGFQFAPSPFVQLLTVRISPDGNVIYGVNDYGLVFEGELFFWTPPGGFVLFSFDEELASPQLSADGSALAGTIGRYANPQSRAVRWTGASGFQELEPFEGDSSVTSISLDGSVIGGTRNTSVGGRAVIWRTDATIGEPYCGPGVPNSTGSPSQMSLTGSNISEYGSMTLQASGLPLGTFGFFLAAQSDGFAAMPAGSQGNLCLGGAIGRFVGPGQIGNSGSTGTLSLKVDPQSLPGPNGPILPSFGGQWYFQAWHRDANPGTTSNFSDAVTVFIY